MNQRRRFLQVFGGSAVAMGLGCGASEQNGSAGAGAGGSGSSSSSSSSSTGSSSTAGSSSSSSSSSGGNCYGGGATLSGVNNDLCNSNAGTFDVGKPTDYPTTGLFRSTSTESNVLIGRDAGGLYALSSLCTHQCCDLNDPQDGSFTSAGGQPVVRCGCHGSEFAYDGSVVAGPANAPLAAYELMLGCDGELYVDTTKTVASSQRLTA